MCMKDSWFIKDDIMKDIDAVNNDIMEYLKSDVPIECYPDDINRKLEHLKKDIMETLKYYLD